MHMYSICTSVRAGECIGVYTGVYICTSIIQTCTQIAIVRLIVFGSIFM